ncbi:SUMO-1 activating enzyme subunit 2 [Cryptosporidium ubiquitum]|uniref:SUMO-activating enzyme subunit n=1 Tax=Cryptosporidium ubiquitum TaxID=857276 RepID=A0A1J4MBW3_9CRYT|nr:SUMO-1 activating enzyme subunit 2 [Cryptosporidium ubiquitum]OII71720.1 SUMO-1 activating enzyme subunit 2 [Cryptosporidium ubiquitum]
MNPFENVKKVLGEELFLKIQLTKIIVVGAGGIGCELVKDLILCGFCNITIIDMDGIDISNLNRQFFFRRKHVGMYKSTVVASEAKKLFDKCHSNNRPKSNIIGIVGNIMDFGTEFFSQFDIVLNALDNISARSYVNKVCLASNIELIDSGSAGYNGQVHPIIPRISRCYECYPPPTQKSFPVCTIRSVPDKPQHTIAWSKYLFEIIFGVRHDEKEDSDNILSDISKKVQIDLEHLKKLEKNEADKFIENYIVNMFDFLFYSEITSLANNKEIYINSNKKIPVPITWNNIQIKNYKDQELTSEDSENSEQKVLSVKESSELFFNSVYKIIKNRMNEIGKSSLCFDKDDKDVMDFISAASNLRSYNFHIPLQSRWACQSIAGSIIPAVASTNAIVSGTQVVQLLLMLKSKLSSLANSTVENADDLSCSNSLSVNKFVWIRSVPMGRFMICPENLEKCNPKCLICSQVLIKIKIGSFDKWNLMEFVKGIICQHLKLSEPSIELNGKCIWDPDLLQEDHFLNISSQKSLSYWKFTDGCIISITDFSCVKFQCDAVISLCNQNILESEKNSQTYEKNKESFIITIESAKVSSFECSNDNKEPESSDDEILSELQEDTIYSSLLKRGNPNINESELISSKRRK